MKRLFTKREKAILSLRKAIEIDPDYAEAYFNRAAAHWKEKNYDATIADFEKAMAMNPAYKEQAVGVIAQAKEFKAEQEKEKQAASKE